jgi:hypothetical protein
LNAGVKHAKCETASRARQGDDWCIPGYSVRQLRDVVSRLYGCAGGGQRAKYSRAICRRRRLRSAFHFYSTPEEIGNVLSLPYAQDVSTVNRYLNHAHLDIYDR